MEGPLWTPIIQHTLANKHMQNIDLLLKWRDSSGVKALSVLQRAQLWFPAPTW